MRPIVAKVDAMVFLGLVGVVVQIQVHVIKAEVIVIGTLIVLEALHAGITTAKEIFPHRVVTGPVLPTAVKVYNISNSFLNSFDKNTQCIYIT